MTRNKSRSGAVSRAITRQNRVAAAERVRMEAEDFNLARRDAPPRTATAPPIPASPPASPPLLSRQQLGGERDDAIEAASVPLPPSPTPAAVSVPLSLLPPPLALTPLLLRKLSSCASSISCLTTSSATYSPRSWVDASSPCSFTDDEKAGGLTRCLTSDSGRTARLGDTVQSLSTEDTVGSPRVLSQSAIFTSTSSSTLNEALDGAGDGDAEGEGGPRAGGDAAENTDAPIEGGASERTSSPPPVARNHSLRRSAHARRPSRQSGQMGPSIPPHQRQPSWHEAYAYPPPMQEQVSAYVLYPQPMYMPYAYPEPSMVYTHGDTHSYPYYLSPAYDMQGYAYDAQGYLCQPMLPAIDHTHLQVEGAYPIEWYTGPVASHTNYVHTPQGSFHKDEYYAHQHGPVPPQGPQATQGPQAGGRGRRRPSHGGRRQTTA